MLRTTNKLVLGTAQLGSDYGITNKSGKPKKNVAIDLILAAMRAGTRYLDTARCYGNAEEIVSKACAVGAHEDLQQPIVITKLNTPLAQEAALADETTLAKMAEDGVNQSCEALGVDTIPVLLIREAWPLETNNGLWRKLLQLREAGLIGKLGLSAQSPDEAELAVKSVDIEHLQIPFNIIDYRWKNSDIWGLVGTRQDLALHVRSVFLQGLLLADSKVTWPEAARGCGPIILKALKNAQKEIGRASVADLCLAYILSYEQVSGVVVGLETEDQLRENLALFGRAPLKPEERQLVDALLPRAPAALLNPSLW